MVPAFELVFGSRRVGGGARQSPPKARGQSIWNRCWGGALRGSIGGRRCSHCRGQSVEGGW